MTVLRVAALAIAMLAVVDPAVTSSRGSRPLVAVVVIDPARDSALSERVARGLGRQFAVVRKPFSAATGTVIVGDALPDEASPMARTVMAVLPSRQRPPLMISDVRAPAVSPVSARIPVDVKAEVVGALGRRVTFELMDGNVLADRQTPDILNDETSVLARMSYASAVAGPSLLTVQVALDGDGTRDSAFVVVNARDDRFDVLFFDPRASWLSTFVRRVVEGDPRFAVSHRVVTSRGLANTGGAAPTSLRNAQALSEYETIVVGAPEQLTEADVAGLEDFMRRRAGRVVLLMDRVTPAPIDRLTGVSAWRAVQLPKAGELRQLQAREIAWPGTTPAGAAVVAESVARDSTRRAVIWSVPVGAGRLLVSGALDAWHYRDPATSNFEQFWTNTVAELSAGVPDAIDVAVARGVVTPGESVGINATVVATALSQNSDRSAEVSAALVKGTDSTFVRLWPTAMPGTFAASIAAPRDPGTYQLIVSSVSARTVTPIVVDHTARTPARDDHDLVEMFAASRGGSAVPESRLMELPSLLSAALPAVSRVETWHPMRSAWWIVPFALLLGAEWWWRRRRGQA
jgi:hypothetical protein